MLQHKPRPFWQRTIREVYYSMSNPLKWAYWEYCKPNGLGVKVFISNNDRLLLLKIGYGHKNWVLPGGAVDRGETTLAAAVRELEEESGLEINDLKFLKTTDRQKGSGVVELHYFYSETDQENIIIDDQEIVDAGWFTLDNVPKNVRPILEKEIQLYNDWKYGRQK